MLDTLQELGETFGPDVLMLGGAASALAGLYLLLGLAWVLVVGGVVAAACGVAAELRWPGARAAAS